MKAKSIKGKSITEIQSALSQSLADGFRPTLAIAFISIKQDREAICQVLNSEEIDIVGATSSGEFIDGYQSQGEMAILLLDIPKDSYSIILRKTAQKNLEEVVKEAAGVATSKFTHPSYIVVSTCLNEKGEVFEGVKLVHTLERCSGPTTDIYGGMAGADAQLLPSWVFTDSQATNEGFVLLALDKDKIDMYGVAISGWKPLGVIRTVTRSEEGWLYEIDGQPALDLYLRYLGESMERKDDDPNTFLDTISLYHPFICLDGIDPLLRTPMFVDKEKKALMLDYPIPVGGKLQFTLPPDFDVVESVLEKAEAIQNGNGLEADALLVFSCLGRLNALGPMATQENQGLYEIWQAPMAGFFTYGEYGQDPEGRNKMHSTTCSWVALKEK
ncbi:MAG: FIST C-terminal domain-containing protein [Saprospiraceae bacterium]|nr:FIST C-terminal domain-containing protein [Saprospiraceae bacterium]